VTTLAEAHRMAQRALGLGTVAQMGGLWPLLDTNNLDGTFGNWLAAIIPLVNTQRAASARLAGAYLTVHRTQALGLTAPSFAPILAADADPQALATSMLVTGPVSIRSALGRGVAVDVAAEIAQARSAASAMRYALNAGRETIVETVKADPRSPGWERVTSGNACDFCTMLADRGAVYGEESVAFEAHDGCSCSAEPVYR
jgi:hypothetical protein